MKKTLKKSCSPCCLKNWQNVQRKACALAEIAAKIAMLANSTEEQGHFDQLFSSRGRHIIFFCDRGRKKKIHVQLPYNNTKNATYTNSLELTVAN
jgi:hypothetical protein